jgi:hypothetical protein
VNPLPKDFLEQKILLLAPNCPSLRFTNIQQLVLQKIDLLLPEDLTNGAPVFLVGIDEFRTVKHFIVHET